MRQVIQRTEKEKKKGKNGFGIRAFQSRLRWQSHFIQKFEMECDMEFKSINKGYHKIIKTLNYKYIDAWEKGKTGIPLVDASMRCLVQTGYLNFRMRALVVSFFVHHLWRLLTEDVLFWNSTPHHGQEYDISSHGGTVLPWRDCGSFHVPLHPAQTRTASGMSGGREAFFSFYRDAITAVDFRSGHRR